MMIQFTADEILKRLDSFTLDDQAFLAMAISESEGIKEFLTALDQYISGRTRAYYFEFTDSRRIGEWLKDGRAQQVIIEEILNIFYSAKGKRKKVTAAILRGLGIKGKRRNKG